MLKTARIQDDNDLLIPIIDSKCHEYYVPQFIQSSPYGDKEHWIELEREPTNYQIVSLALQSFTATTSKYAFEPYEKSFNIDEIIDIIKDYCKQLNYQFPQTSIYIIAFRSILYEEIRNSSEKRQVLAQVDKASHYEANQSGGLLKYWFGVPDDEFGQNLATCWWVSRNHARLGGGGRAHREGMQAVKTWFKYWQVEEYELTIANHVESFTLKKIDRQK